MEWTPERRKRQSAIAKARWGDPEKCKVWIAGMQGGHTGTKLGQKHKDSISRAGKIAQNRPEVRERMCQIKRAPEEREKMRQSRLRQRFVTKGTKYELLLEKELRKRRLHFEMHKRMFPHGPSNTPWICDFVFGEAHLIVEVDEKYWHDLRQDSDRHLAETASQEGWTLMRFPNSLVESDARACARAIARFVRSVE